MPTELNVNGMSHRAELDSRITLLDALREKFGLTGAKRGVTTGSAVPVPCSSTVGASSHA
jgi:xanthine dehydrogenase YagT iron-sulfur-binding subunit